MEYGLDPSVRESLAKTKKSQDESVQHGGFSGLNVPENITDLPSPVGLAYFFTFVAQKENAKWVAAT